MATNTENHRPAEADAFPTPSPAPFRTPSRAMSRRSHRRDSSPGPSSSPPSLPLQHFSPDDHEHAIDDVVNDDTISPLDPRRFTPTLHASLVSEILSLRRELESKNKAIDALEASLEDTRAENEALNESLSKHTKENRSLKRQMQLLEGGTLSALSDLAKERDEAVENITDVRKRLEQTQKRARSQEEEVERTQMLWDRDKQAWESERRNWERKVHVMENRLKMVLNEVAAAQAAGVLRKPQEGGDNNDPGRETITTRGSDTTSVRSSGAFGRRRASTTSESTHDGEPYHSGRFSSMSFANGHGVKPDGLNLAEELAFDEEDEEEEEFAEQHEELPEERERPTSVQSQLSYTMALKARKILGLSIDGSVDHPVASDVVEQTRPSDHVEEEFGNGKLTEERQLDYRDVGVQYSPPPSPQLLPQLEPLQDLPGSEEMMEESAAAPASGYQTVDSGTLTMPVAMVSSSCQTVDLPSPPLTPKPTEPAEPTPGVSQVSMTSNSTQTEPVIITTEEEQKALEAQKEPQFTVPIPTIAIHPPGSEPSSPRSSVVLPPHTKSVACQTDMPLSRDVRSVSMQTEEIRIDKRPVKLPASLLPSAIVDRPTDKSDSQEITIPFAPPPRSPKRPPPKPLSAGEGASKTLKGKQPERVQAYPGNNDNGPLADNDKSDIRRPFRSSSLFAGFDDEEQGAGFFSDDELYNRPMASYSLRSGKMVPRTSLDENPIREVDEPDEAPVSNQPRTGSIRRPPRGSRMASTSTEPDIRRAALISNGVAAHQKSRPRSPSDPSIDSAGSTGASRPPFPVPVRLSSRKVPTSASEGAQSPTPYSNRNERRGRAITRQPTLRKVRSAAAISRANQAERPGSRSPPAMSTSSYAPDSPQPPPMPHDDVTAPRGKRSVKKQPSTRTGSSVYSHTRDESTPSSVQPTSVVDAIAQTMVGEWMYKYVRRRKSFGVSDAKDSWELGKNTEEVSANITSTGVRHKRWVWLAPYERAVMWSSKQPTSGTALLGKSGRKLTIQSVLDVKDDTPMPKGSSPQSHFNRSILILTPQRALKFTAMSLERHYVWLTALSFLSHSSIGMSDLAALPPVPQDDFVPPPPAASLRRNPIRDSIRVAKSKPRQQPNAKRSFTAHPAPVPEYGDNSIDPMDAADPPNVPRFSNHTRRRSNTAPRAPPSAFRSFSSNATVPSTYSGTTAASSDLYTTSSMGGPSFVSGHSSFSRRTSEASGPSSAGTGNFFDAVGTVRMEAFIDRVDIPRYRGDYRGRNGPRKKDSSQWGSMHHDPFDFTRSDGGSDIYYRNDDPFRGF